MQKSVLVAKVVYILTMQPNYCCFIREHVADADAITVLAMRIGVKGMAVRRNLK